MTGNTSSTSFRFAVDDKEVIKGLPLNRNACTLYTAEKSAIKFVAQLLKERGWGIDHVRKHQRKYCPHRILAEGRWNQFSH